MSVLALASEVETAWWITLGIGLVVVLVVWALLELLRRTVVGVEESVESVWESGKRLAQNTQTGHLLQSIEARADELRDEIGNHAPGAERRP